MICSIFILCFIFIFCWFAFFFFFGFLKNETFCFASPKQSKPACTSRSSFGLSTWTWRSPWAQSKVRKQSTIASWTCALPRRKSSSTTLFSLRRISTTVSPLLFFFLLSFFFYLIFMYVISGLFAHIHALESKQCTRVGEARQALQWWSCQGGVAWPLQTHSKKEKKSKTKQQNTTSFLTETYKKKKRSFSILDCRNLHKSSCYGWGEARCWILCAALDFIRTLLRGV